MTNQNQLLVKMALDAWNSRVQDAEKFFNSLSDEQLQIEVAPNRNRGIYLLGHLTAVHDRMLPLLNLGEQMYPQLNEAFISQPDKAVAETPSASELKNYFTTVNATLAKHFANMQPDEWFERHTSVSPEDFAKEPHRNRLNIIISRTNHMSYHQGQLNFLKK